jgi:hypothetical protein
VEAVAARSLPVVFVLAGSSGSNAGQLQERMASRPKGADLLSHIPPVNIHTIPALGIGDRVLAAAGQLRDAAAEASHRISAVEKMALFYLTAGPRLENPQQLRELCVRAAGRLLPREERLRYDHLFSPGNPDNKAFWMQWQAHHHALVGRFVRIDD